MRTLEELTQAYHNSDCGEEQEDVIKELLSRGEVTVARALIETLSLDEADEYTHVSYACQQAMVGSLDVVRAHVIKIAEETGSFVYCLELAERVYKGASIHEVDERWSALIKELFERAISCASGVYGASDALIGPMFRDVEEEDHYHAEIACSIHSTIKDEALFHKALRAGVDLSKAYGGGTIDHFFSAVPPGWEMTYFELYIDDFMENNESEESLRALLRALDYTPDRGEAKALLIQRLTEYYRDEWERELPEKYQAMIQAKEV